LKRRKKEQPYRKPEDGGMEFVKSKVTRRRIMKKASLSLQKDKQRERGKRVKELAAPA
jgi:hypothetical protein